MLNYLFMTMTFNSTGPSLLPGGAPSISACDSTFSKNLGKEIHNAIAKENNLGMDHTQLSPVVASTATKGEILPSLSRPSSPFNKLKRSCTVTSPVRLCDEVEDAPFPVPVPDASQNSTALLSSHPQNSRVEEVDTAKDDHPRDVIVEEVEKPEEGEAIKAVMEVHMTEEEGPHLEGVRDYKPMFHDPTLEASEFFKCEEDDPLLEDESENVDVPKSFNVAVTANVIIPELVRHLKFLYSLCFICIMIICCRITLVQLIFTEFVLVLAGIGASKYFVISGSLSREICPQFK